MGLIMVLTFLKAEVQKTEEMSGGRQWKSERLS